MFVKKNSYLIFLSQIHYIYSFSTKLDTADRCQRLIDCAAGNCGDFMGTPPTLRGNLISTSLSTPIYNPGQDFFKRSNRYTCCL